MTTAPPVHDGPRDAAHGPCPRVAAALVAVLVVLLVLLTLLVVAVSDAAARAHRDQAVLVAAREQVLDLVNINPATAQASFDRALAASTGEWKQRLVATGSGLTEVVTQARVDSRAAISEAGLESADDDRAKVLVTAALVVGNAQAPAAAPRALRFLLGLERADDGGERDGTWLVSNLEIAP